MPSKSKSTRRTPKPEPIILGPYVRVDPGILIELKRINAAWSKTERFDVYLAALAKLFHLDPAELSSADFTETQLNFFGGFNTGEGSIFAGVTKNASSTYGIEVRCGYGLTQHINGIKTLVQCLAYFQRGVIRYKTGSVATFELKLVTTKAHHDLRDVVTPFYRRYVVPYASPALALRLERWVRVIALVEAGAVNDPVRLVDELLPLCFALRVQVHKDTPFKTLEEAVEWVAYCVAVPVKSRSVEV